MNARTVRNQGLIDCRAQRLAAVELLLPLTTTRCQLRHQIRDAESVLHFQRFTGATERFA
jgi:hypothetical protein